MKNNKLNAVKEHWEDVKTVSLKDNNLQLLERRTILDFIERTKKNTLKDIGCGDGSDTKFFAEKFNKVCIALSNHPKKGFPIGVTKIIIAKNIGRKIKNLIS